MGADYMVVIEKADDGGYSVYVPDLPGCMSAGDTVDEAMEMIAEAISGHVRMLEEQGEPIPTPRSMARVVHAA